MDKNIFNPKIIYIQLCFLQKFYVPLPFKCFEKFIFQHLVKNVYLYREKKHI